MAIVIRGKSVCHLCQRIMQPGEDIEMFPPGLFPPGSRAARLDDASVHTVCFSRLEYAPAALAALEAWLERTGRTSDDA